MSYEEKGAWVYLVASVGTLATYLAIILGRTRHTPVTEVAYVSTMLWTIGISVTLSIVGRVAVEIARPSDNHKSDVRDKDINRFGEYVGGVVLAIGMLVPFGLTLASSEHFWIAHAMFAAFYMSALVSTPIKLVAYRRGL